MSFMFALARCSALFLMSKFACCLDDEQMGGYGQSQSAVAVHPILPG